MKLSFDKQSRISFGLEMQGKVEGAIDVRVILGETQKLHITPISNNSTYIATIPALKDFPWLLESDSISFVIEIISDNYFFQPVKKILQVDRNTIELKSTVTPPVPHVIATPIIKETLKPLPQVIEKIEQPPAKETIAPIKDIPVVEEISEIIKVELTEEQKLLEAMREQGRIRKQKQSENKRKLMLQQHPNSTPEQIEKLIAEQAARELSAAFAKQKIELQKKQQQQEEIIENARIAEDAKKAKEIKDQEELAASIKKAAQDKLLEEEQRRKQKQNELLTALRKN